jgi:uncharacterized protein YndB with AHSA1/START domain
MEKHGCTSGHVEAPPDEVFDLITSVDRLPEWNACIAKVLEPRTGLEEGAQWVVEMNVHGMRWPSRSTLIECDRGARRYTYRSQSDDGNPSFALWTWELSPADGGGTDVTLRWNFNPRTFWRKAILVRIRNRQSRHETHASMRAMQAVLAHRVRPG